MYHPYSEKRTDKLPPTTCTVPLRYPWHVGVKNSRNTWYSEHSVSDTAWISCESQLLVTLHNPMSMFDCELQVDVALLDFSKAFNTVPHEKLLDKLKYYAIHGNIHSRIASFLKHWQQCVVIDGDHYCFYCTFVTIGQCCLFVWATVVGIGISYVIVHSRWIEVA